MCEYYLTEFGFVHYGPVQAWPIWLYGMARDAPFCINAQFDVTHHWVA